MKTYHFVLWLQGVTDITEELENKIFESGCDDALLGTYHSRPFLEFDREADSLLAAVKSALGDTAKAGLAIERIGFYDFVTAAEIARRVDRSRANVSQLISGDRGPGNFPAPFQTVGNNDVWPWPEVEAWFANYDEDSVPPDDNELREIASAYQFVRTVPKKCKRDRLLQELGELALG
jgi:hypothetical protein